MLIRLIINASSFDRTFLFAVIKSRSDDSVVSSNALGYVVQQFRKGIYMHQLNKLLLCVKQNPELFKKPDIGFIVGLTSTQIKELKKYATANNFIIEKQRSFYLTSQGEDYLKNNPIQKWSDDIYSKRPEVNLEYLKLEKAPATLTKAIRCLARHLLSNEELKPNSTQEYLFNEIKEYIRI